MDDLADWLRIREPADIGARSEGLARRIARAVATREVVDVLDLATGTGSNFRYLAPKLGPRQRWLVVDRDPALLALIPNLITVWGAPRGYAVQEIGASGCLVRGEALECRIETRLMDLGTLDDPQIFQGRALVTASALLDLVSESWIVALAWQCRRAGAAALFAITYNGRFSCTPADPEDEAVRDLFNRHQKTDKGLGGPAEGPAANAAVLRCFAEAGYEVRSEASDWTLDGDDRDLQRRLVEGWADAAREIAPGESPAIARWRARRLADVEAARSRMTVGHFDVAAWPSDQMPTPGSVPSSHG